MQAAVENIQALSRILVGIRVPPVSNGKLRVVGRHGKGLRDAINTTWIAAQVGAISPRMRVQVLDNLVAAR